MKQAPSADAVRDVLSRAGAVPLTDLLAYHGWFTVDGETDPAAAAVLSSMQASGAIRLDFTTARGVIVEPANLNERRAEPAGRGRAS